MGSEAATGVYLVLLLFRYKVISDVVILWAEACQAPLSMGSSRQECWSVLPFPSLGDLPNPGMEPGSPVSQADSLLS